MDPGDPRTLDPYRYADNNPINYTDASGLAPSCSGLTGTAYMNCNNYSKNTYNYSTGVTVQQNKVKVQQNNANKNGQVLGAAHGKQAIKNEFIKTAGTTNEGFSPPPTGLPIAPNNATPWQVGSQWLTGVGPRTQVFGNGSKFSTMLGSDSHYQNAYRYILKQANAGELTVGPRADSNKYYQWDYGLSGVDGVGKYVQDYSTLLTAGKTGNLAKTYLGSHQAAFVVTEVSERYVDVSFLAWNTSSLESATRPPVIGYWDVWTDEVGPRINDLAGSSGPMSPTRQYVYWEVRIPR